MLDFTFYAWSGKSGITKVKKARPLSSPLIHEIATLIKPIDPREVAIHPREIRLMHSCMTSITYQNSHISCLSYKTQ